MAIQHLKLWFQKLFWLFILIIFLVPTQSLAQSVPEGWTKKEQDGNLIFSPRDLKRGQIYTISISQEQFFAGQNLGDWADNMVSKHISKLGAIVYYNEPHNVDGIWARSYKMEYNKNKVFVYYAGFPVKENIGRLIIVSSSIDKELASKHGDTMMEILRLFVGEKPYRPLKKAN